MDRQLLAAPARLRTLVACAILAALAVAVFGRTAGFEFVTSDDHRLVEHNPLVAEWSSATMADRFLTVEFSYAIPVTVWSFAADHELWDGSPAGFHLTNVVLHLACALLVFAIIRRLLGEPYALFGALIFLLHPVQTEAVAFVTQRKDLLATLFSLVGLERVLASAYGKPRRGWAAIVLAAVVLAGLSKPSALLIGPMLVAVWVNLRHSDRPDAAQLTLAGLLCLLPFGLLALNLHVHSLKPEAIEQFSISLSERMTMVGQTSFRYLESIFVPIGMAPKVPRPEVTTDYGMIVGGLAIWASFGWVLVRSIRARNKVWVLVIVWCFGAYLPVSNWIPLRRYVAGSLLYLAMPAVAIAGALALRQLLEQLNLSRRWVLGFVIVIVVALALATARQVGAWRDEASLFAHLYRLYPDNRQAVERYTEVLEQQGKSKEALAISVDFLERAVQASPLGMTARHRLMRVYLAGGQVEKARRLLVDVPDLVKKEIPYWEARLELAMHEHKAKDALVAVERIVAIQPTSPRKEMLPELRKLVAESASD